MELRDYQQKVVSNAPNKWYLFFKQRVGKTPTAIRLASTRTKSCLVIAPASIQNQWQEEIDKWNDSDCKFKVISKDKFRINADDIERYDAICLDECHRAGGNYKSKFYKALQRYIKKYNIEYVWGLTGTPMTSSSWSVYSYGNLIGRDWNWFQWRKVFFKPSPYLKVYNHRTRKKEPLWVPKDDWQDKLLKVLPKIGTIIDLKDVADLPNDEDIVETFSLLPAQNKAIKNVDDFLPIVKYTKYHQIESGNLKGNDYEKGIYFACNKDKRILELVEDNDKVIIVVAYLDQIDRYKNLLSDYNVFEISGKSKEPADVVSKEAEKAEKAVVIAQADTGVGYSLKSFNTMVFASMSYSFVNYDQMRYRIKATDKKIPNTYIHLLIEKNSIDRAVYKSVKNKEDFNAELFNNK